MTVAVVCWPKVEEILALNLSIGITELTFGSDSILAICAIVKPPPCGIMYIEVGPMLERELVMLDEIPVTSEISATIAAMPIMMLRIVRVVLSLRCDIPFNPSQNNSPNFIP